MLRKMTEDRDQLFERCIGRPRVGSKPRQAASPCAAAWAPPMESAQRDNPLLIRAEVPGVKQEDVRIEIKNDRWLIKGDRHEETQRELQATGIRNARMDTSVA